MNEQSIACPYCRQPAPLVSGLQVYPHISRLWPKKYYKCTPCDAWVGCHPPADAPGGGQGDGTVPMGPLANAALRAARQAAHDAFDGFWKRRGMSRRAGYRWLASQLRIEIEACHIGHFDEQQCIRVVDVVQEADETAMRDATAAHWTDKTRGGRRHGR